MDTEDDLPPPEDGEDGVQEKSQRNLEARDSGMPGDGQIKGNTTATTTEVITTSEGRVSATRSESYFEGENPLRTTTSTAAGGATSTAMKDSVHSLSTERKMVRTWSTSTCRHLCQEY